MREGEQVIAVGLLTARDLGLLGEGFRRVYPLDSGTDFSDLLRAIDDAEAHEQQATGRR